MTTFGERLKDLRNERHMKQDDLAHAIEVAPSTVGAYERNTRQCNYEILCKIADLFNCSVDYLLCRTDDRRTVELALQENSQELKEFLAKNSVLFNGAELSLEDKRRIMDILTGMFWNTFNNLN